MYNLVVMDNFGAWLRDARKELRLTQDELAKKSGVSASYISTLERNQPHSVTGAKLRPEPDKVRALAEALEKEVSTALKIAGYAPDAEVYPQTEEELAEALKKYGVKEWKVSEKDLDKLGPDFFKSLLENMEMLTKGKLQKLEEGEQVAPADIDKVA